MGSELLAFITDKDEIRYRLKTGALPPSPSVRVFEDGREIALSVHTAEEGDSERAVRLSQTVDLTRSYTVELEGYGIAEAIPTSVFDSEYFAKHFHYDGALGAFPSREFTDFALWAPTARRVVLNLFYDGGGTSAYDRREMKRGECGVWRDRVKCGHGTYYTYTVTTPHGTGETVDPYAVAAGVNGERGMVVDLSLTDPSDWSEAALRNPISDYSDAVIWEVHVRDFSGRLPSIHRGKYLAFTERGLVNEHGVPVGLDYLVRLGVTHVHLLPVFDYATVDESDPDAGFNWGYDPKNYNLPEGSYSSSPYDGATRITELKRAVQALHGVGIGVVADVVYNHTYEVDGPLGTTVPYYYYRYGAEGYTSASLCGNDTASERYMFRRFMVDSASYWVSEYKLDGLRFDLMGLHDLETMRGIERAVHAVNPHAIIYGEGWKMGETLDGSLQASCENIAEILPTGEAIGGISVFNDVTRDGLKGSAFDPLSRGYINGAAEESLGRVLFGISGGDLSGFGWRVERGGVINYMSAHDNHTLWDKLALANSHDSEEDRARMVRLGAAIIMISRGTPFFQAGEEMLRTKWGDENSYASPDSVNNLDWSLLSEGSPEYQTSEYYRGLIRMRRRFAVFRRADTSVTCTRQEGGAALLFTSPEGGRALVLLNPSRAPASFPSEGEWHLVADGERSGDEPLCTESGILTVEPISAKIYLDGALISEHRPAEMKNKEHL